MSHFLHDAERAKDAIDMLYEYGHSPEGMQELMEYHEVGF